MWLIQNQPEFALLSSQNLPHRQTCSWYLERDFILKVGVTAEDIDRTKYVVHNSTYTPIWLENPPGSSSEGPLGYPNESLLEKKPTEEPLDRAYLKYSILAFEARSLQLVKISARCQRSDKRVSICLRKRNPEIFLTLLYCHIRTPKSYCGCLRMAQMLTVKTTTKVC